MKFLWFAAAGALSGVLGGMGMGGGTLLIPLLGIFYKVPQHAAQAINLISFVPMAALALIVHAKNGLVRFREGILVALPAVLFGILGAFAARGLGGDVLKRVFGGFLIALSVFQAASAFVSDR